MWDFLPPNRILSRSDVFDIAKWHTQHSGSEDTGFENFWRSVSEKNIFYLWFWAILDQKFDKSSEPAELNERREACNSAKWLQCNPHEISQNFFEFFFSKKIKKSIFWPKNDQKIEIFRNFFEFFLAGISLKWSKTYFKTKISISKIFSHSDLT